jgi:hypothetical protein
MKRTVVIVALMGCLMVTTGCGTAAKAAFREIVPIDARFLEIHGNGTAWTTYGALEFGTVTDASINGRAPAELKAVLLSQAAEQLTKENLFTRVGGSGREKTVVVSGDIIDVDSGGAGAFRAVGFGDKPFVTVRTTFTDKASGKALAVVNLQGIAKSALANWADTVSKGYGKAIADYLESKGMQKLPDPQQ